MPTPELQTQMTISRSEDGIFHINGTGKYRMSHFWFENGRSQKLLKLCKS